MASNIAFVYCDRGHGAFAATKLHCPICLDEVGTFIYNTYSITNQNSHSVWTSNSLPSPYPHQSQYPIVSSSTDAFLQRGVKTITGSGPIGRDVTVVAFLEDPDGPWSLAKRSSENLDKIHRRRLTLNEKERAKEVRKVGACLKCRGNHRKCTHVAVEGLSSVKEEEDLVRDTTASRGFLVAGESSATLEHWATQVANYAVGGTHGSGESQSSSSHRQPDFNRQPLPSCQAIEQPNSAQQKYRNSGSQEDGDCRVRVYPAELVNYCDTVTSHGRTKNERESFNQDPQTPLESYGWREQRLYSEYDNLKCETGSSGLDRMTSSSQHLQYPSSLDIHGPEEQMATSECHAKKWNESISSQYSRPDIQGYESTSKFRESYDAATAGSSQGQDEVPIVTTTYPEHSPYPSTYFDPLASTYPSQASSDYNYYSAPYWGRVSNSLMSRPENANSQCNELQVPYADHLRDLEFRAANWANGAASFNGARPVSYASSQGGNSPATYGTPRYAPSSKASEYDTSPATEANADPWSVLGEIIEASDPDQLGELINEERFDDEEE